MKVTIVISWQKPFVMNGMREGAWRASFHMSKGGNYVSDGCLQLHEGDICVCTKAMPALRLIQNYRKS
jgi:hypothetical protein